MEGVGWGIKDKDMVRQRRNHGQRTQNRHGHFLNGRIGEEPVEPLGFTWGSMGLCMLGDSDKEFPLE